MGDAEERRSQIGRHGKKTHAAGFEALPRGFVWVRGYCGIAVYATAGAGVAGAGVLPLLPFWVRASFQVAIMDLPAEVVPNWMIRASSSPNFFSTRAKAGRKPLVRALRTAWAAPGALMISA